MAALEQVLVPARDQWVRVCGPVLGVKQCFGCFSLQNVNVVEQEKIDKLMLEMDGTENKCEWALCCTEG